MTEVTTSPALRLFFVSRSVLEIVAVQVGLKDTGQTHGVNLERVPESVPPNAAFPIWADIEDEKHFYGPVLVFRTAASRHLAVRIPWSSILAIATVEDIQEREKIKRQFGFLK